MGLFGTGQAYEALLLRLRANPLAEARAYGDLMLEELRKVIPAFLTRVDHPTVAAPGARTWPRHARPETRAWPRTFSADAAPGRGPR